LKLKNSPLLFSIYIYLNICFAQTIGSTLYATDFKKPLFICPHPTIENTMFVLEQGGLIWKIKNQKKSNEPFLNLKGKVHTPIIPGDERGLLGLAIPSDFEKNQTLYVNYVNKNNSTIISRINTYTNHEEILIQFDQPYSNHNGGMMAFGPEGYLYISVGDGGNAGDPENNAQNLGTFLGSILRIDVNVKEGYLIPPTNPFLDIENAKDEIWAYGLRNAWRFSFDKLTGDLYIGDVGQHTWEEINFQYANSKGGENYGWNNMEGFTPFEEFSKIDNAIPPIYVYPNDANIIKVLLGWDENDTFGCSVTGGYVYRGGEIPSLFGHYVFSDYCTGKIWSFKYQNQQVSEFEELTENINIAGGEHTPYISSLGEDTKGELYFVDYSGDIYKIGRK